LGTEFRGEYLELREEVTGVWRKFLSQNILRMIKSRRKNWAGHVVSMWET
jgi:hypothetical protein